MITTPQLSLSLSFVITDKGKDGTKGKDKEKKQEEKTEKSVLQQKLSRLAIQIGYAGKRPLYSTYSHKQLPSNTHISTPSNPQNMIIVLHRHGYRHKHTITVTTIVIYLMITIHNDHSNAAG